MATCKDCTERHVGCHSTCQSYLDERKEIDRKNKEKFNRKMMTIAINSVQYNTYKAYKEGKKKGRK